MKTIIVRFWSWIRGLGKKRKTTRQETEPPQTEKKPFSPVCSG